MKPQRKSPGWPSKRSFLLDPTACNLMGRLIQAGLKWWTSTFNHWLPAAVHPKHLNFSSFQKKKKKERKKEKENPLLQMMSNITTWAKKQLLKPSLFPFF